MRSFAERIRACAAMGGLKHADRSRGRCAQDFLIELKSDRVTRGFADLVINLAY